MQVRFGDCVASEPLRLLHFGGLPAVQVGLLHAKWLRSSNLCKVKLGDYVQDLMADPLAPTWSSPGVLLPKNTFMPKGCASHSTTDSANDDKVL